MPTRAPSTRPTTSPATQEPVAAEPVRGGSDELDVPDFMR
jgi:hypothetical protein